MERKTPSTHLVRAGAFEGYNELAEEYGLDHETMLKNVGISLAELADPEFLIRYEFFIDLLNLTEHLSNCERVGLELGSKQGVNILGTLGYVIQNSIDLGGALQSLSHFYHQHHTSSNIIVEIEETLVKLSFDINIDLEKSLVHACEVPLAIGVNVLRMLTNNKLDMIQITLPHDKPKNIKPYLKILGQVPIFNADSASIYFDTEFLRFPIQEADPALLKILKTSISQSNLTYTDEIPSVVESLVRQQLNLGRVNVNIIADKLAMSARTLQRHLKSHDTSFRSILDKVRNKLAHQYLLDSSLALIEIASILQFNNYSEFTRAFKRMNDMAPREYRKQYSTRAHLPRHIKIRH